MSFADQQQFIDAVRKANQGLLVSKSDLQPCVLALNRLAMSDMLAALSAVRHIDREYVAGAAPDVIGEERTTRINWAVMVVEDREIRDFGLPLDQVNDGREYLGCTRLDDAGVRGIIHAALDHARMRAHTDPDYRSDACCGPVEYAWLKILVKERRKPGHSLKSNLAAAAHYMLARYHVCAAKATVWQMKAIADAYDAKKRLAIARGDLELRSIGLTANRPFPPDFAIADWAGKGAQDGEHDRIRCNSEAPPPIIAPDVNKTEWGE
jgi:hypothetical protein